MKEYILIGAGMSLVMLNAGFTQHNPVLGLIGLFTALGWFGLSYFEKKSERTRKLKTVQTW